MMPMKANSSASTPLTVSSSPTCGPTNSMRRSCTCLASASSACRIRVLTWAELAFSAEGGRRISTFCVPPKYCTTARS